MEPATDANGSPFIVQDLLCQSVHPLLVSPLEQPETLFQNIDFNLPVIHLDGPYTDTESHKHSLHLPDLYDFNYASLPALDEIPDGSLDNSVTSSVVGRNDDDIAHELEEGTQEDVWHFADILGPLTNDVKYLSWEAFSTPEHIEECPLFLSEAGSSVFDAALELEADNTHGRLRAGKALQPNTFLRSLWQLCCGRTSVLFPFDPKKKIFYRALDEGRLSGYSLISSQSIETDFLQAANATVELRQFIDLTYTSSASSSGLVALASAVSSTLDAIEFFLLPYEKHFQSLLQLQALFERPKQLLLTLKDVVNAAISVKTDEEILSIVFSKAHDYKLSELSSRLVMSLVSKVSRPWLSRIEQQVGLLRSFEIMPVEQSNQEVQAEGDSLTTENDTDVNSKAMPLLSTAGRKLITASTKCLTFLEEHHPGHPLCKDYSTPNLRNLELAFDWTDLERIEAKAKLYHNEIQFAVNKYNCNDSVKLYKSEVLAAMDCVSEPNPSWPTTEDPYDVNASAALLDSFAPTSSLHSSDEIFDTLTKLLQPQSEVEIKYSNSARPFSPVAHLSLQPLLAAQYSLLTTACLRDIVLKHSIRKHFDLCHKFHLCASGFFTSRLSSVLFDPSFESAKRERNVLRSGGNSLGLKLGNGKRRDWPPASSELRLALRGVLTESWRVSFPDELNNTVHSPEQNGESRTWEVGPVRDSDLPGGLSFTLRTDLQPEEIERVLDPDSVYALDFLSLTYTPSRALQTIFTTPCLNTYSRIFRLMLRMLRMNFLVGQIFRYLGREHRGSRTERHTLIHRFRQESTYFITTLISHFVHTGIGRPWTRFQNYLEGLERFIRDNVRSAENADLEYDIDGLTAMHEATLRTITTSLFLRTRQRKAFGILESICDTILQFVRVVGDGTDNTETGEAVSGVEEELRKLHSQFNEQQTDFVAACRLLSDKAEFGGRRGGDASSEEGALAVRELVEFL